MLEVDEGAGNNNTQSSDLGGGDGINQRRAQKGRAGLSLADVRAEEGGERSYEFTFGFAEFDARGTFGSGTDPSFCGTLKLLQFRVLL